MGCKDTQNYYLRASNYSLIKVHRYYETEIFYSFFLLLFLLAGQQTVAQKAPNPFDIEQPSLRVFLPAPELATGERW